jgi:hypothetical protein
MERATSGKAGPFARLIADFALLDPSDARLLGSAADNASNRHVASRSREFREAADR